MTNSRTEYQRNWRHTHPENVRRFSKSLTFKQFENHLKNSETFFVRLPDISISDIKISKKNLHTSKVFRICEFVKTLSSLEKSKKNLVFYGPMYLLPFVYNSISIHYKFKYLISIRLKKIKTTNGFLPNETLGLIIFSTNNKSLNDVRKPFELCKCCKDTVKDYGGKKHLLEKKGTRISDVWTDFSVLKEIDFPNKIVNRVYDLTMNSQAQFSLFKLDLSQIKKWNLSNLNKQEIEKIIPKKGITKSKSGKIQKNKIFNDDILDGFKKIPDNSVDLALVDPPYNISIRYAKFSDNLDDDKYLEWSKKWIDQISRTLRPGGLLTLVNIPKWSLELFPYLQQKLCFQGWLVWDSFSYPSTPIMPSHYPILCFSKGPKLKQKLNLKTKINSETIDLLEPLNYGYCIRSRCLKLRTTKMKNDKKPLTDLWTEIHRIRHNSFRYNHPTLMPQKLAKRIILSFSKNDDVVLDCFNGVGTTSLVAKDLGRNYLGIEKSTNYYKTSIQRHKILENGKNPFQRKSGKSTTAAKGYPKIKPQIHVQKRILQIEVKNVAKKLGHIPTKSELGKYGKYPLKFYLENFRDWTEITVAARRSGI